MGEHCLVTIECNIFSYLLASSVVSSRALKRRCILRRMHRGKDVYRRAGGLFSWLVQY
jgi:hypothetical protein